MDSADNAASSNDDSGIWGGVGPKPWWFDDPEILAARQRVLEEFGGEPDESAVSDVPEGEVCDASVSSVDDAAGLEGVWGGVGPKPWWFDDPEISAARQRVLEEFGGEPDESAVCDVPEGEVCDKSVSSVDDAAGLEGAWGGVGPKPWWFDDPEILAARRRVLEEFGGEPDDRPECTGPDPILNDVLSGASVRELGQARDDLARAKARYEKAIHSARTYGLSWGEIGAALGVPRQLLHRRFARRLG